MSPRLREVAQTTDCLCILIRFVKRFHCHCRFHKVHGGTATDRWTLKRHTTLERAGVYYNHRGLLCGSRVVLKNRPCLPQWRSSFGERSCFNQLCRSFGERGSFNQLYRSFGERGCFNQFCRSFGERGLKQCPLNPTESH